MKRKGFVWLGAVAVSLLAWAAAYGGATTILKGDQLQGKPTITIVNGSGTLTLPSTTGTICHKGEACNYTTSGAASTPAITLSGSPYTGGTTTTTKPLVLIEPTGTTSTGWSTSGTLFGINAPSGFLGRILDVQANGTYKFYVDYNGAFVSAASATFGSVITNTYNATANNIALNIGTARTYSSANQTQIKMLSGQSDTSSSGTGIGVAIQPTYNQTSTAGGTDLLINRTETAVGSGSHKLLDAQVGGTTKFSVERTGAVAVAEQSTPSTPSSGYVKVYPKTDKRLYLLDSAGNENAIGSGSGQGGINYLTSSTSSNNSDLETSVGDWLAYADAAGTSPVDGTGGSPAITCTRTTSSPLRGTGSLLITKDAANRQGEGCAVAFTIDRADLAKPLMVEFDYEVASGTYGAGSDTTDPDLVAYVYGPTDGTPVLTQLAPYKVLGATSGTQMKFQGRFQTASSGVAYRLILHEAKTGTSAYTAKLDNLKVGPEQKSFGPPVTDWTSFTPTGSWSTNTTYTGKWRRVGDQMEIQYNLALAGAPTAANLSLNLPSGYTIDTAKIVNSTAQIQVVGQGSTQDNGTALFPVWVRYATSSTLDVVYADDTGSVAFIAIVSSTAPFTFGNTDSVTVTAKVPISGWGSTVQMSNDTDTRVVAASYSYSTSQTVNTSETTLLWDTGIGSPYDSHSGMNTGTGIYTIPVPGWYEISANLRIDTGGSAAASHALKIYRNAQAYVVGDPSDLAASKQYSYFPKLLLWFNAGDTTKVTATSATNSSTFQGTQSELSIKRLSGPAQIAATETVAARYTSAAGQSIPDSTYTVIDFGTKDFDTHGAVTTGASWKFTAPISGKYRVNVHAVFASSTFNAGSIQLLRLFKNGSSAAFLYYDIVKASATNLWGLNGAATTISLVAGDYINVQAYQAGMSAARSLYADAEMVYISIERVGN